MIFEISIHPQGSAAQSAPKPLRIKAEDWFTAMREGLPKLGISVDGELQVALLDDELSAVVDDAQGQRKIFVLAIPTAVEKTPVVQPTGDTDREHMRFESQPIPIMPSVKPDTFSLNGAYVSGTTTDFLTEAFMKVGDLYGNFGDDLQAAMAHLFAMLQKATKATGGSLLLSDINDPTGQLQGAFAQGPQAEAFLTAALPGDQGAIGHCVSFNEKLNVESLASDPRFPDDPLTSLGVPLGPVLCVPIHHQQQLLGVVVLYKAPSAPPFAQGELNIFAYLSDAIGTYLHLRSESLQN